MVLWEPLDALSHQLELCALDHTTRVAVLFDHSITAARCDLVRAAVARSGSSAVEIRPIRSGPSALTEFIGQPSIAALLAETDLLITNLGPELQALRSAFTQQGRRVLHLGDSSAAPDDYPPHVNLQRRVTALTERFATSTSLELIDRHGTDLTIDLTACTAASDDGLFGNHAQHAEFPAGWVELTPANHTVQGDLVLMPGDSNVTTGYAIRSPIRLAIRNDHIAVIEGDNPDADMLRAQFEFADDANAYGTAALTIGLNPGRRPIELFDDRLLDARLCRLSAGVLTFSFGENLVADRPCRQRVTVGLPTRTLRLDGLPVVTDGRLEGDFAPDVYER